MGAKLTRIPRRPEIKLPNEYQWAGVNGEALTTEVAFWYAQDKAEYEAVWFFLYGVERFSKATEALLLLAPQMTAEWATWIEHAQVEAVWPIYKHVAHLMNAHRAVPMWWVLQHWGDDQGGQLLSSIEQWAENYHLIDVEEQRRRYVEIGLRALYALRGNEQKPKNGNVLTRAWKINQEALQEAIDRRIGHEVAPFEERHPIVFAPFSAVSPDRPAADPYLLYDYWRVCKGEQPQFAPWRGIAWDPLTPWAEFKNRMLDTFDHYLQTYHDTVARELTKALGWSATTESEDRTPHHYLWLAAYQCGGMSLENITKATKDFDAAMRELYRYDTPAYPDPSTRSTVGSGTKSAAALVGIQMRPPSHGGRKPNRTKGVGKSQRKRGRPTKRDT